MTDSYDPTRLTYDGFMTAYEFFNEKLFGDQLPNCLITIQRKNKLHGYFSSNRFITKDRSETTDEIALNPVHFNNRTFDETMSTLVHEMCHLEQQHFGTPSRNGYHNQEWGEMMEEVGLIPSSTGAPGGKKTGQKVSHYIVDGGKFALVCKEMIEMGLDEIRYGDRDETLSNKSAAKKTKVKYSCNCGVNAWGKPGIYLICGDCGTSMDTTAQDDVATGPEFVEIFRRSVEVNRG